MADLTAALTSPNLSPKRPFGRGRGAGLKQQRSKELERTMDLSEGDQLLPPPPPEPEVIVVVKRGVGAGRGRGRGKPNKMEAPQGFGGPQVQLDPKKYESVGTLTPEEAYQSALKKFEEKKQINFDLNDCTEILEKNKTSFEQLKQAEEDNHSGLSSSKKKGLPGNNVSQKSLLSPEEYIDGLVNKLESVDGRSYLAFNKDLIIPPIPYESNEVWDPADIEYARELFLGPPEDDCKEPSTFTTLLKKRTKPVEQHSIVRQDDRFFMRSLHDAVQLPEDYAFFARLLCVDEQDTLYCRYFKDKQYFEPQQSVRIDSYDKLLTEMTKFYDLKTNRVASSVGANDWIPALAEIVVVRVKRNFITKSHPNGYTTQGMFQRAQVIDVIPQKGLLVSLLDDYGVGGIPFKSIYRIRSCFTYFPPQLFKCQLAGMKMFNWRKVIHQVLQKCPIRQTWGDCSMNMVKILFKGKHSKLGFPLVDVDVAKLVNDKEYVSLRMHVKENIACVMSPLTNLKKDKSSPCEVIGFDSKGYVWLRFDSDNDNGIRMRVARVLDDLEERYKAYSEAHQSTVEDYLPEDNQQLRENNAKVVYIAAIQHDTRCRLHRIKLVSCVRKKNVFRVRCIESGREFDVSASSVFRMDLFSADLAYLPPTALKVHLYNIRRFLHKQNISKILLDPKIEKQVRLKLEFPDNVLMPEVILSMKVIGDGEEQLINIGTYFLDNNWATKFSQAETQAKHATAVQLFSAREDADPVKYGLEKGINEYQSEDTYRGINFNFSMSIQNIYDRARAEREPQQEDIPRPLLQESGDDEEEE